MKTRKTINIGGSDFPVQSIAAIHAVGPSKTVFILTNSNRITIDKNVVEVISGIKNKDVSFIELTDTGTSISMYVPLESTFSAKFDGTTSVVELASDLIITCSESVTNIMEKLIKAEEEMLEMNKK